MEKHRMEDGFAVILVKHEVARPGEAMRRAEGGEGISRLVLRSRTHCSLGDEG